ncbi:hypothetical protein TWF481_010303 [Arthrobotrys musiformis]|uniref:Nucleoside phosphorylase domain-containing protein n=1 Tax=Arthrobotrys musiformis TaxID=47236 RepID=A0AAV9W6D7_9PEZI
MSTSPKRRDEYTIGWICALSKEQTAATLMLDETHPSLDSKPPDDTNVYTLGSIGHHNVAITCLPLGYYGTNQAAKVANNMRRTFSSIRSFFLVGIGAGIAGKVELGDVVIGTEWAQWDFGKTNHNEIFEHTGKMCYPPQELLSVVQSLQSRHEIEGKTMISTYLDELKANHPNLTSTSSYTSIGKPENAKVHYGLIASGNQVVKDEKLRGIITKRFDDKVLCIEMEAAGLVGIPAIVIRGICDYADSNKNDKWQNYAAAVAAACTKELLGCLEPATLVDLQARQKEFDEAIENLTGLKRHLDRTEDRKILAWITPIDGSSHHNDTLNRRQAGTCEGLLNSTEYQDWLNTANAVLFCRGIPGAGKTVLSSAVIAHLFDRYSYNSATIGVAYIYFNFKESAQLKVDDLLSDLLKQLARTRDPFPSCLKELYDGLKGSRPSRTQIIRALGTIVASYSRVFVVIDALDEYNQCSEFLAKLFEIYKGQGFNILSTSRPIPEIRQLFDRYEVGCAELEITAAKEDIERYLEDKIRQSGSTAVLREKEMVKKRISEVSQGMFLLARLYFEAVNDATSQKTLKRILEGFSAGSASSERPYDIVYEAIMKSIRESTKEEPRRTAFQVLSWIISATRPLKPTELRYAIAVEHPDEASEIDTTNLIDAGDLVSWCRGLVTIDKQSDVVRLIHYTVQEYFERTKTTWFPNSHSDIAKICVIHLSHDTFKSGPCSNYEEFKQRLQSNPLYEYAAKNWSYHIRQSTNDDEDLGKINTSLGVDWFPNRAEIMELVFHLLSTENIRLAFFQAMLINWEYEFRDRESLHRVTKLHIAAYCGLSLAVKEMLSGDGVDLELEDDEGHTAVLFAVQNGHKDTVRLLVERGANLEARDSFDGAAIHAAVARGYRSIVQLLKEKGVNLEVADFRGRTPLLIAAQYGNESIVRLLMEGRVNLEAVDTHGTTVLAVAAGRGYENIVVLLIEGGANVNGQNGAGKTALMAAAGGGYENIVSLLIKGGANVDGQDENGETALMAAVRCGNYFGGLVMRARVTREAKDERGQTILGFATGPSRRDVARFLIEALIDWEDEDNYRDIMLASAEHGFEDIIRLLMEKGVGSAAFDGKYGERLLRDTVYGGYESILALLLVPNEDGEVVRAPLEGVNLDALDDDGETALERAIHKRKPGMVRILLEKGASVGGDHLYAAVRSQNNDIIKILIDGLVDLKVRNTKHRTPLLILVKYCAKWGGGWEDKTLGVEMLVKRGANLEARDTYGQTSLSIAAWYGDETLVRLLVGFGADLEARDNRLQTPLSIAAWGGHEDVVRLLVEEGADLETIDEDDKTPLQHAIAEGCEGIIEILATQETMRQGDRKTEISTAKKKET